MRPPAYHAGAADGLSPPVFHDGDLPVGFEVDSPLPQVDLGHGVLHGDVGDDLDGIDFHL